MAAINSKEAAVISQFRQRLTELKLEGELNSDLFLIRWLRARDLNLDQAEKMLRKHMQWRKETDFDSIVSYQAPEAVTSTCGYLISGVDNEKAPILVIPIGRWKIRKLAVKGYGKDLGRYYEQMFVKTLNEAKGTVNSTGVPVTQFIAIADMEKMSMKTVTCKAALAVFLHISKSFEANFPEQLKACYILNAGKVFATVYALLKPIMSKATIDKIKIYHNDKWKKDLFAVVAKDQIPVQYGGTSTRQLIIQTVAATEDGEEGEDGGGGGGEEEDRVDVTIEAGDILVVELQADKEGGNLTWSFETEEGDIEFSICLNGTENLVSKMKVPKGKFVEGSLTCKKVGGYKLLFDNSGNKKAVGLKYMADVSE